MANSSNRKLYWNELNHNDHTKHGHEGLIIKLNEKQCVKVYSPSSRDNIVQAEYENHLMLLDSGLLTPKPDSIVDVIIKEPFVMLPSPGDYKPVLRKFYGIKKVQGLVREYLSGENYIDLSPSSEDVFLLADYMIQLISKDLYLKDSVAMDFILTPDKKVAMVDATDLHRHSHPSVAELLNLSKKSIWFLLEDVLENNDNWNLDAKMPVLNFIKELKTNYFSESKQLFKSLEKHMDELANQKAQ